eukprot:jgi/Ulvmu1/11177/UM072_0013.1
MANFQSWSVDKLRDFIAYAGSTPQGNDHDTLLISAVQIHSTNERLVQQFESSRQSFPAAPSMSHNSPYPPFPGAAPPAGAPDNPYGSPRTSGSTYPAAPSYPPANAPSYPPASAPSYPPAGSAYPPPGGGAPPAQSAYPDVNFAAGAGGPPPGAGAPALPPYMNGTGASPAAPPHGGPHYGGPHHGGQPHHGQSGPHHTPAHPSPYPGAAASGPSGASPYPFPSDSGPKPSNAPSPYPFPSGSGPKPSHAPSPYLPAASAHHDPHPAPSLYPTPNTPSHNPSPYPKPNAPSHSPAPSPYPKPNAPPHSSAPSPYPAASAPHPKPHAAPYPPHGAPQQQPRVQSHPHASQGRKKALLIGCNYPGTSAELKGCCTDVQHVEYLLRSRFGFTDITVLRDDQHNRASMPTRNNILRQMDALVRGASSGDSLFFHFSGHGSQKRDWSGDERDGMNETICPTDFRQAGQIVDDELNKHLVNPLGHGVRLHALLDACHSGTGMDLRHVTKLDKRSGAIRWRDEGNTRKYKGTKGGLAVQFGACKDSQTAADTASLSGGTHTGAATFLFIQACERLIKHQQPLTYSSILRDMLHQIEEFNKKNGRGSSGFGGFGGGGGGGLGGGIAGLAVGALMGAMTGHGLSGAVSGAMSALSGGSIGGQTPQLSASDPFNLETLMHL